MSLVGFVGLGNMGGFMARNLLKKGCRLIVYDIDSVKLDDLKKMGAEVAKSPAEIGEGADKVIFTMLPNSAHVQSVYDDCSTIDPLVSADIADKVLAKQAVFLDAPVSGGVVGAENATLTFMVGGCDEGFEQAKPYFDLMGKNAVHCGKVGSGQATKICNNMLLGIHMVGVAEAMNLGVKLGLDPRRLSEIINTSSGRCWSTDSYNPVPGVLENVPASRGYVGGFGNALMAKDLGLAQNVATKLNSPIPLGSIAHQLYRILSNLPEFKDKDFSSVYEFLKRDTPQKS